MKNLLLTLCSLLFIGCTPSIFYQVYQVQSSQVVEKNNKLIYENNDCVISYNLWGEGGDVGFVITNKTDQNLVINKDECFFIKNGFAYNYFQNRVFTTSSTETKSSSKSGSASGMASISQFVTLMSGGNGVKSNGVSYTTEESTSKSLSLGFSQAEMEEKNIIIPPKSSKIISEYFLNPSIYRDCNLLRYPSKKEIIDVNFEKENSPYVFKNIICYTLENAKKAKIENEFFINKITNYSIDDLTEEKYYEFCGYKSTTDKVRYFLPHTPKQFYVKYNKDGMSIEKH